jgi:rhamnulokinase
MKTPAFLAFDLGAESGRTVLGWLENRRLRIKELHRFLNGTTFIQGHLYWNIFHLFEEMKKGMKICGSAIEDRPESIGIDTWGVDFGLLARDGTILGLPYAYRDRRTEGIMEEFFKRVSRERIYQLTGIQFMELNSLFQLFATKRDQPRLLDFASDLLFMPDIFNYLMTGVKKTEFTFATTSQLYNPLKKDWAEELFEVLGVSKSIMQEIVPPGTVIGNLDRTICQETGLRQIPVSAVASHDTGSAVAAVPAEGEDWAYISSGTWSLMGVETREPVINDRTLNLNFTNEGGVEGTFRLLKNITGLWLLQECRKAWAEKRDYDYGELVEAARNAPPFRSIIHPDWEGFLNPPNMPGAIREFCLKTEQPVPDSPADFVRCILESLALKYGHVLDQLKKIYPNPVRRIHIIGGGAQNRLLCQFTANATGLPVTAGPSEATAVGNIMVQALSLNYIASHQEMREIIRESFELVRYEPEKDSGWESAYERFQNISAA